MEENRFQSCWQTVAPPEFPKLSGDCNADAVIVGEDSAAFCARMSCSAGECGIS